MCAMLVNQCVMFRIIAMVLQQVQQQRSTSCPDRRQCSSHEHLNVVEHLASQPGVVSIAAKQLVPKRPEQTVAWRVQALQGVRCSSRPNHLSRTTTLDARSLEYVSCGRTVWLDLDNAQSQVLQLLR